jgi:hypothetical protein
MSPSPSPSLTIETKTESPDTRHLPYRLDRTGVYLRLWHKYLCAPPDLGVDLRWSRKRCKTLCAQQRECSLLRIRAHLYSLRDTELNRAQSTALTLFESRRYVESRRSNAMPARGQRSVGHNSAVPCAKSTQISLICDMT